MSNQHESSDTLPGFIEKITGAKVRSTTDDGAVMELMDAFGLLPSRRPATRNYDAEGATMRSQSRRDNAS